MPILHQQEVEKLAERWGIKLTPQRRAIIGYLQSAVHHPTADEVLKAVNEEFPMTSRATVYNTLNWLKGVGLVKEVFEAGIHHFDPNTAHHHHFICRKCGRVEDVDSALVGNFQLDPLPGNHMIENFEVIIRGLCSGCRQ